MKDLRVEFRGCGHYPKFSLVKKPRKVGMESRDIVHVNIFGGRFEVSWMWLDL